MPKKLCPECDKEFDDDGAIEETPCCKFPIRSFEKTSRVLNAVDRQKKLAAEAEEKSKKANAPKKTALGGLVDL